RTIRAGHVGRRVLLINVVDHPQRPVQLLAYAIHTRPAKCGDLQFGPQRRIAPRCRHQPLGRPQRRAGSEERLEIGVSDPHLRHVGILHHGPSGRASEYAVRVRRGGRAEQPNFRHGILVGWAERVAVGTVATRAHRPGDHRAAAGHARACAYPAYGTRTTRCLPAAPTSRTPRTRWTPSCGWPPTCAPSGPRHPTTLGTTWRCST